MVSDVGLLLGSGAVPVVSALDAAGVACFPPRGTELLGATRRLLDEAPDVVVATTGIGFRGWIEAAEGWGLGDAVLARLNSLAIREYRRRAGPEPPPRTAEPVVVGAVTTEKKATPWD